MTNWTFCAVVMALSQIATIKGKQDIKQHEHAVTGLVVINGTTYRATCNCPSRVKSLEDMIYHSRELCHPSKVKIRFHGKPDKEEYKLIQRSFRLLPHEDFKDVDMYHIASMDGRASGKAFYAPGGDLGLFIMAMLNQYEGLVVPDQNTVTALMRQYVKQLPVGRSFYHATDTRTLESICKALQWDIIDITNIDPVNQKKVRELIGSGSLGDPFIKFLLEKFRKIPAKKSLVLFCVNAFFEIIWDKEDSAWEQLVLEVLEGVSSPSAVVEISVSKGCQIARMVPQVLTKVGDKQLLIYTEHAANQRKREIATYIYKQMHEKQRNGALAEVLEHMDKLAHMLMEEFGTSLSVSSNEVQSLERWKPCISTILLLFDIYWVIVPFKYVAQSMVNWSPMCVDPVYRFNTVTKLLQYPDHIFKVCIFLTCCDMWSSHWEVT